jgi:uncharacterized protein YwqG
MLRELKIAFSKTTDKIEYPDNLGKRSKLGGSPDWIQESEKVICSKCKKPMEFVGQIDSMDYTGEIEPEPEYMFGDVGMIYVFFCFECLVTKSVYQGY